MACPEACQENRKGNPITVELPTVYAWNEEEAGLRNRWNDNKLPLLCRDLFTRYCIDFSEEAFERFYRSTLQIFQVFTTEKCAALGADLDPNEIVNRLYGLLVAHASLRRHLPIRSLLSWCFGTICNMIKEERRHRSRKHVPLSRVQNRPGGRSPLDQVIHREESAKRGLVYKMILNLILTRNPVLSDRERKVMAQFYFEGLSLRRIASNSGINAEHAAVILFRARRRIALLFGKAYS